MYAVAVILIIQSKLKKVLEPLYSDKCNTGYNDIIKCH